MTIDYTTDIGKIRLLVGDTATTAIFSDTQYNAFLAVEGDDIRLAAAQALDAIASSKAMLARKAKIGNLSLDETSVAKELRERASSLREQATQRDNDGDGAAFDIVDFDPIAWLETSE